ncbi:hypothetical protein AD998_16685 [bacterium 336/3]|nr:hypothetical protein AD998_16685 [bacterium 336/3]
MENIVKDTTGLIHLASSIIALVTGLYVIVAKKGTQVHKKVGYIYALAMLLVNLTAFMIYRLYGKIGIFHGFAILSCITLFAGLYPVITKKTNDYLVRHFRSMYWSVVGLYCAFVAEIFSRLPKYVLTPEGKPMVVFYQFVSIGTALVMMIGVFFFLKFKPIWEKQYKK